MKAQEYMDQTIVELDKPHIRYFLIGLLVSSLCVFMIYFALSKMCCNKKNEEVDSREFNNTQKDRKTDTPDLSGLFCRHGLQYL